MNKDSHLIWENYRSKTIDDLIKESFERDVVNVAPLLEQQLLQEGIIDENLLGKIGGAISTGFDKAKELGGQALDKAKELGGKAVDAAKNVGSKVAGAVSDKLVRPLLDKAWAFLQKNAPDVAQRISAEVAAGDANALQAEIQAGGGDQVKNQIANQPDQPQQVQEALLMEYLTTFNIISEADIQQGQTASMATAASQQGQQGGGGMLAKAMNWMKQNPNLTTASALGLIGLAGAALGGAPLLLMAAKGAGWGGLIGGAVGGGTEVVSGLVQGKGVKQSLKDAGGAALSGARKGAVMGAGGNLISGLIQGVGRGAEANAQKAAQEPAGEPAADGTQQQQEPDFSGTKDVSRGSGSADGATPQELGDPNYNKGADLDFDGDVDARDAALYKMQQRYDAAGVNADASQLAGGPGMDVVNAPAAPAAAAPVAAPAAPVATPPVSDVGGVVGGAVGGTVDATQRELEKRKKDSTGTRMSAGGNRLEENDDVEEDEDVKKQKMLDSYRPGWATRIKI